MLVPPRFDCNPHFVSYISRNSAYTIKTFKIPWISVSLFYKMIHYYIILVQPVKNKTVKQLLEILSVLHRLVKNKSVNEGCWKG